MYTYNTRSYMMNLVKNVINSDMTVLSYIVAKPNHEVLSLE